MVWLILSSHVIILLLPQSAAMVLFSIQVSGLKHGCVHHRVTPATRASRLKVELWLDVDATQ